MTTAVSSAAACAAGTVGAGELAPRPASRRRGAKLEDAILAAAFAELVEVGYTAFSVENVAARAATGKASIYRRWPSKPHLVLDAMLDRLPTPAECGLTVDIEHMDDSITTIDALRGIGASIAAVMSSPAGDAMRAVKCEALADPELARMVDERFQGPRREAMLALLRRGVARGEVRPDAVTQTVADVLPAVIGYRAIMQRERLTAEAVTEIIDDVLVPLVAAR